MLPILLDGSFTDANIQLEQLAPNALRTPEPIARYHLLHQADRLRRSFRLARARSGCMLPEQAEKLSRPSQERLWLNEEQRLFPGLDSPGEKDQQQSIRLPTNGSFDLSMQDDQLLAQQRMFRQQFSFAPGQIGKSAHDKGGCRRFDPTQEVFWERTQAGTKALFDQGKHAEHE